MKKTALFLLLVVAGVARAETELACWNMFSARGSRPILKAKIEADGALSQVNFDLAANVFESYAFHNEHVLEWHNNDLHSETGTLAQPAQGRIEGSEITTNRSPYRGNNEYAVSFGHYVSQWPADPQFDDVRHEYDYTGRLILPKDLSNDFLRNFRIRTASERSNAVMVYGASPDTNQGGDNYLRMFCTSR